MAQPTPPPSMKTYLSSTLPTQPNAGPGPVTRFALVNATGSSVSISTTAISASGMSGLVGVTCVNTSTTPQWIVTSTATSNGDGTFGASTGPWIFGLNDTRPSDLLFTLVSRE